MTLDKFGEYVAGLIVLCIIAPALVLCAAWVIAEPSSAIIAFVLVGLFQLDLTMGQIYNPIFVLAALGVVGAYIFEEFQHRRKLAIWRASPVEDACEKSYDDELD